MKTKTKIAVTVLTLAAAIWAQDVKTIFTELQQGKSRPAPVVLQEAPPEIPVVQPDASLTEPVSAGVEAVVEAEPAVVPEAAVETVQGESEPVVVPEAAVETVQVESEPAVVPEAAVETVQIESESAIVPEAAVETVQVESEPAVAPEAAFETIQIESEPSADATMKGGLISLNLKEVELSNVIRLFATLSDANIIVPTLEGTTGTSKVDVNLKEVEWKSALQSILDGQGLELYEKNPGSEVYSVRKKLADAPVAMDVKIFKLNYASVSNVHSMISSMLISSETTSGKIAVFPSRNTLVVQSTPENLLDIEKMIMFVDLPRQQVFIEAKFMELTDGASKQLGIDWQMLGGENGGYGISGSGIGGNYSRNDTLTEKRYTDISGRSYEDALLTTSDLGGRSGYNPNTEERIFGVTPTILDVSETTKALGATISADDFKLVLAALKEISGIKVVSNPKIIVANEEKAQIYVGDKEPNIKQDTTQAQQADAVTTYNLDPARPFFEYGIKLDVTPTINTASNITVDIVPSLSRKTGEKTVGNGGTINTFPITSEKTISTVFALESGQTAAIGGLTEVSSNDIERKIPLLGSLPLIGRFFSYSNNQNKQVETIIFVTVGLANPENINMETGLPQESSLAMRYDAQSRADRQIRAEELKILNQSESDRSQQAVQKLRDAEQKRIQNQK